MSTVTAQDSPLLSPSIPQVLQNRNYLGNRFTVLHTVEWSWYVHSSPTCTGTVLGASFLFQNIPITSCENLPLLIDVQWCTHTYMLPHHSCKGTVHGTKAQLNWNRHATYKHATIPLFCIQWGLGILTSYSAESLFQGLKSTQTYHLRTQNISCLWESLHKVHQLYKHTTRDQNSKQSRGFTLSLRLTLFPGHLHLRRRGNITLMCSEMLSLSLLRGNIYIHWGYQWSTLSYILWFLDLNLYNMYMHGRL